MIVLGIIGILATIAIHRYLAFKTKSMQAEVKLNLEGLRAAETTYFSENNAYTDDLTLLTWTPEGSPRYLYGFVSDANPDPSGTNDTAELAASTQVDYSTANMVIMPGVPLTKSNLPAAAAVSGTGYTAGAVANLDEDMTLDTWTLDQNGLLTLLVDD